MNVWPNITNCDGSIVLSLPVTAPTSKIRAKRPQQGYQSEPLATRRNAFARDDYLEWQISYDTEDENSPTRLAQFPFNKPNKNKTFYPCELMHLFHNASTQNLLLKEDLHDLSRITKTLLDQGVEELESIPESDVNNPSGKTPLTLEYGFQRKIRMMPRYVKMVEKYFIEIEISPKQRAVGNQAMVYLCLPIRFCVDQEGSSLIGRTADKKERVKYIVNAGNASLIKDTIVAFLFASKRHREDLNCILDRMGS